MTAALATELAATAAPDELLERILSAAQEAADGALVALFSRCPRTHAWQLHGAAEPRLLTAFAEARPDLDAAGQLLSMGDGSWHLPLVGGDGALAGCLSVLPSAGALKPALALALAPVAEAAGPACGRSLALREEAWQTALLTAARALPERLLTDDFERLTAAVADAVGTALGAPAQFHALQADGGAPAEAGEVAARALDDRTPTTVLPNTTQVLEASAVQQIAVPLRDRDGGPVGVVCAERPVRLPLLRAEDLAPLSALAGMAALALFEPPPPAEPQEPQLDEESGCLGAGALPAAVKRLLDTDAGGALLCVALDAEPDAALIAAVGASLREGAEKDRHEVVRTGPGEFAVLHPGIAEERAPLLAPRLRLTLRHKLADGQSTTACVGVATAPRHGSDARGLLGAARGAVEAAQEKGPDHDAVASGRSAQHARALTRDERLAMLRTLSHMVDDQHFPGVAHSFACADRAQRIALEVGLDAGDAELVARAAEFHEVGRALVPQNVFNDPTPSHNQRQIIQGHVLFGARLLHATGLQQEAEWVAEMHEHWDGNGQPGHKAGGQIPVGARVLLAACLFEQALHAAGGGRDGMAKAAESVRRDHGRAVAPELLDLFDAWAAKAQGGA